MSQITKSVIYDLGNSLDSISISVQIGYAQPSISKVFIAGKMIEEEFRDSFEKEIETTSDLRGKEIVCFTSIFDMQPHTNETSLKLKVRGSNGVLDVPILKLRANQGEVVFYKLNILVI